MNLNEQKNHVPQGGIEPTPSLVRSGLAIFKGKKSSMLPTELYFYLFTNFDLFYCVPCESNLILTCLIFKHKSLYYYMAKNQKFPSSKKLSLLKKSW